MNSRTKKTWKKHRKTIKRAAEKRAAGMALAKKPPTKRVRKNRPPLESHERIITAEEVATLVED